MVLQYIIPIMKKELGCSFQQYVCQNQEQFKQIADHNKASSTHKGWLQLLKADKL